jgi:uncharacterized protein (DUF1015 family)
MVDINPLYGIRYNQECIKDLSAVICPPYDIISPAMQRELYIRSPHNFVRIEYGEELPQDSERDNKYTRAAGYFGRWQAENILCQDTAAAVYVHDHYFIYMGREHRRRGLACRIRLEEWDRMVIRPHEGTLAGARGDRSRLLWTLKANTSPVLCMYRDNSGSITSVLEQAARYRPIASSAIFEGERHELFSLNNELAQKKLIDAFSSLPLYIADGHHRYESALTYRNEQKLLQPDADADAAFNFVLMTLVDMDDPGLVILPPHRLLRGLSPVKLAELEGKLPAFFDIEKLSKHAPNIWARVDALQSEPGTIRLVLVGLKPEEVWILTLRDVVAAFGLMPYFHTDNYKRLDVSLVDHIVLEEMLGLKPEGESGIAFDYDRAETLRKIEEGDFQLAFIVKPVRPETIKDIADAQDRMPRKSTYFYPKLPSGLVINSVAD